MLSNNMESISLINTPYHLDEREVVCYPYLIIALKIQMPRPFMKPRIAYTVVTADLVKGMVARSNMFPETNEIEIDNDALVPTIVSNEEALKKARKLSLKWAMYKFHLFRNPEIEVVKMKEVYKAFFYVNIKSEKVLVDSVKGLEGENINLLKRN